MQRWLTTQQAWLVVKRLPAYAPDLNPVEGLWSCLKTAELADLTGPNPGQGDPRLEHPGDGQHGTSPLPIAAAVSAPVRAYRKAASSVMAQPCAARPPCGRRTRPTITEAGSATRVRVHE
jgi:hypothetical protein